jgi:hypothetical protein
MFEYIVFETNQEQVDAIDLPKLGILYKNLRYLKNGEKEKIGNKITELQYFCDTNGYDSIHNRVPITFSFHGKIREKFEINKMSRVMTKPNLDVIAATEKLQNKK